MNEVLIKCSMKERKSRLKHSAIQSDMAIDSVPPSDADDLGKSNLYAIQSYLDSVPQYPLTLAQQRLTKNRLHVMFKH